MDWDPSFADRSPGLVPLAAAAEPLRACRSWPSLRVLQDLCDARGIRNARGMPLRLSGETNGEHYETRLYVRGEMHVRAGDWHDLFNVLAWLAYPETKAALNARHHEDQARGDVAVTPRGRRTRVRDALTLFDESGAIVVASDPALLDMIRAFEWKRLFWIERARAMEHLRVFVIGHALAQKLLTPYVGLTAHALLLPAVEPPFPESGPIGMEDIDRRAAALVASKTAFGTPRMLSPLPVLGISGWSPDSGREAFYEDTGYFRLQSRRRLELLGARLDLSLRHPDKKANE